MSFFQKILKFLIIHDTIKYHFVSTVTRLICRLQNQQALAISFGDILNENKAGSAVVGKGCFRMKIEVCIGSSCHIKGSRQVIEQLQGFIETHQLKERVELCGSFCMGACQQGVCVKADGEFYSLTPESVSDFFHREVLVNL